MRQTIRDKRYETNKTRQTIRDKQDETNETRQMRQELSKYVRPPVPGTNIIFGLRINSLDQDDNVIKNQIV